MSISVNSGAMRPITSQPMRAPTAEGQAFRSLAQSLRAGDVDAAKTAYADVIRNAPEGATLERGSPFVQVGAALRQGDLDAAKAAFVDMVKTARGQFPQPSPPVAPPAILVPAGAPSIGSAGGTLNEIA